jgi:hypothetical protein
MLMSFCERIALKREPGNAAISLDQRCRINGASSYLADGQ